LCIVDVDCGAALELAVCTGRQFDVQVITRGPAYGIGLILADTARQVAHAILLLRLHLHGLHVDRRVVVVDFCASGQGPGQRQCDQQRGAHSMVMVTHGQLLLKEMAYLMFDLTPC